LLIWPRFCRSFTGTSQAVGLQGMEAFAFPQRRRKVSFTFTRQDKLHSASPGEFAWLSFNPDWDRNDHRRPSGCLASPPPRCYPRQFSSAKFLPLYGLFSFSGPNQAAGNPLDRRRADFPPAFVLLVVGVLADLRQTAVPRSGVGQSLTPPWYGPHHGPRFQCMWPLFLPPVARSV